MKDKYLSPFRLFNVVLTLYEHNMPICVQIIENGLSFIMQFIWYIGTMGADM